MRRYKGFTFVELMMVLLVLGIIIMLTMPLLKNLKDDSKIYRAYMKKANQDVTDAVSMALIKNRYFTGFDKLGNISVGTGTEGYNANAQGIKNAISVAVSGKPCGITPDLLCLENTSFGDNANPTVGLVLSGKSVMMFQYGDKDGNPFVAQDDTETTYGYIYIDMNGNKSPNENCKDRYTFQLYKDRAVMVGCDLSL